MSFSKHSLILVILAQTLVICILGFQWVFFNSTYTKIVENATYKAIKELLEQQPPVTNQNTQIMEITK
jgi:ABC-type branched-subunit amino acid transport system permease subunit